MGFHPRTPAGQHAKSELVPSYSPPRAALPKALALPEAEPAKATTMVWSFSNQEDARLFIKRFEKFARLEGI